MNKFLTPVIFFIAIFLSNAVAAQDEWKVAEAKDTEKDTRVLSVLSLDGKKRMVKVIPDYVNKVLRLSCMTDAINIISFWGVPPEIHLLNKNFIEIIYEVRGGSNLGLGNTLILCLKGNKLYEAIHILRHTSWDSGDLKVTII